MSKVNDAEKITNNRFLNLYKLNAETKSGNPLEYLVASRAKKEYDLKAISQSEEPDAVAILGTTTNKEVVLIRQFRYPIGDYIYELPAGLIDEGEEILEAARREMKEETGLCLEYFAEVVFKSLYSSPGMTDENCAIVIGNVDGEVSNKGNEATEDIEVVLADKEEVIRILRDEKLCMKTALLLGWWLRTDYC